MVAVTTPLPTELQTKMWEHKLRMDAETASIFPLEDKSDALLRSAIKGFLGRKDGGWLVRIEEPLKSEPLGGDMLGNEESLTVKRIPLDG